MYVSFYVDGLFQFVIVNPFSYFQFLSKTLEKIVMMTCNPESRNIWKSEVAQFNELSYSTWEA